MNPWPTTCPICAAPLVYDDATGDAGCANDHRWTAGGMTMEDFTKRNDQSTQGDTTSPAEEARVLEAYRALRPTARVVVLRLLQDWAQSGAKVVSRAVSRKRG